MSRWVRTQAELRALAEALRPARRLALDSESDSLYHHREKVCLLQLADDQGGAWLVDTLALRAEADAAGELPSPALAPLAAFLADPAVVKVLHGADYDVTTLKRDFGFSFTSLFDTMLAARFLGLPQVGLQGVAQAELGVELTKGGQTDDWSRRPLTPAQEAYAIADVTHLLAIHERLRERLREKGRLSWVEEECEAVAALEPARRREDPDAYLGVKGARKLPPRKLAALRELFAWREQQARTSDIPAFKILSAETLLALAEGLPGSLPELGKVRGVLPRLRRQAGELLQAVERARAMAEADLPVLPRGTRPFVSPEAKARGDALKAWRAEEAARQQLDVSLVLPQRLMDRVAEGAPRSIEDLAAIPTFRRWRAEAFGPAILTTVAGKQLRL